MWIIMRVGIGPDDFQTGGVAGAPDKDLICILTGQLKAQFTIYRRCGNFIICKRTSLKISTKDQLLKQVWLFL